MRKPTRGGVASLVFLAAAAAAPRAQAVIIVGDLNDPTTPQRNVLPAPNGLSDYLASFGTFLATPIAPRYFAAAAHILNDAGTTIVYNNGTITPTAYTVTEVGRSGDLAILKIADADPVITLYAPLYTATTEVGRPLVVVGRGTTRGAPMYLPEASNNINDLRGWQWGAADHVVSWGTNVVDGVADGQAISNDVNFAGDMLVFGFDRGGGHNEGILSVGDSSGPVFVLDPGDNTYKLAAINSLVDNGPYSYSPAGADFTAGIFDARGFYYGGDNVLINPNAPGPIRAASYSTRIASRLEFISAMTENTAPVPEPGLALLVGAALPALALRRNRRRRA